jgi:hypothetical protein
VRSNGDDDVSKNLFRACVLLLSLSSRFVRVFKRRPQKRAFENEEDEIGEFSGKFASEKKRSK